MRSEFINWIKENYDVTLTDEPNTFDWAFTTVDTKDMYELYCILNHEWDIADSLGDSLIYYEHNLFEEIADHIREHQGTIIYLSDFDWLDYIVDEFPDFEDEDEDEDE